MKWVLDLKEDDVYWCIVDLGWVIGIVYGIFVLWLVGVLNVILGGCFSLEVWYEVL